MRITLVGYMCSGKSTIGRKLAFTTGHNFLDLDERIEEKYHISISDFFRKYDENAFRKTETETLHEIMGEKEFILSTGGGTPCFFDNMEWINHNSLSFYIELPLEVLIHRILESKKQRPMLVNFSGSSLNDFVAGQLEQRVPCYLRAHHTINCTNKEVNTIASEILNIWNSNRQSTN